MPCYKNNKNYPKLRDILGSDKAVYFLYKNNGDGPEKITVNGKIKDSKLYSQITKFSNDTYATIERFRVTTSNFKTWFGDWENSKQLGTFQSTNEPKIFFVEIDGKGNIVENSDCSISFTDKQDDNKLQIPVYVKVKEEDSYTTNSKGEVVAGKVRFPFQIQYALNSKEIKETVSNTSNELSIPGIETGEYTTEQVIDEPIDYDSIHAIQTAYVKKRLIESGSIDIVKDIFGKLSLPTITVEKSKFNNDKLTC